MHKIIFTGGGSAGHVTPNIAIMDELKKSGGWEMIYIGSKKGIERELIQNQGIRYIAVQTGKLRRYFSLKNFADIFRTIAGVVQCYFIIRRIRPRVVFSKGGFVGFPVAVGAYLNGVPVLLHEADMTPGLANKLSLPFADRIFLTFEDSVRYLKPKYKAKALVTGLPLRIFNEQPAPSAGDDLLSFETDKPVLFVFGGSLGSAFINNTVRQSLGELLQSFNIIHVCGKGHIDEAIRSPGYRQVEFLKGNFFATLMRADYVVSRAGANSIFEIMYLRKLALFIPLSGKASRGDQIINARHFYRLQVCEMMLEEECTPQVFTGKLNALHLNRQEMSDRLAAINIPNANKIICDRINVYAG